MSLSVPDSDIQEFQKEIIEIMVRFDRAIKKGTGIRFSARDMEVLSVTSWAQDAFIISNPLDEIQTEW
jgi:hypothetical protein